MDIFQQPEAMRAWAQDQRKRGTLIGLVPTMGFLHEGHASLMRLALQQADTVVVSVFVNPTQFAPNEDLAAYPRDFEHDVQLLKQEGVAAVFAPTPELMYPPGFQSEVQVKGLTSLLEGRTRPTHFAGVTTVVSKLFHIVQPDIACFGEKDFQQLAVIRRMVADLNMAVRIVGGPIIREPDGLAQSSRNTYLDAAGRTAGLSLFSSIRLAQKLYADGERRASVIVEAVRAHIQAVPLTRIDYAVLVNSETLEETATADEQTRLMLAVYIKDKVRLIDNALLAQSL